jgi:glucose-6-phosphate isomerase
MSNFFAQPDALALGKSLQQLESEGVPEELRMHKLFPGDRPSLSILFDGSLNPRNCG